MSRTRKGGKYTGGSFASQFSMNHKGKSPLFATAIAGQEPQADGGAPDLSEPDAEDPDMSDAAKANSSPNDIIPKKLGSASRRSARDDFFNKTKEMEEEAAAKAEAERLAAEEEAAAKEGMYLDEDGKPIYDDDYDPEMTGKERRAESKANKGQIKDEFKADKAAIKASGLKGSAKRQAIKAERKKKKSAKKSNRKGKRNARRVGKGKAPK